MGSRVMSGSGNTTVGPVLSVDKALSGVPRLLDDLQRLSEDTELADVVFILGNEGNEEKVSSHRLILMARCKAFQTGKRNEVCRIPGVTVVLAPSGMPTLIRLPHVTPETFRRFSLYIYTGKVLLQDSMVFEMMALAQELGVEELRNACEDHVTSTLSVASACTFLAAALDIEERVPGGKAASAFIERCVNFIGEHALECMKTNSFLSLSKDAVIKLISSDHLCMEEEDVWRAALAWAKYKAGVTQPTHHWTEEERMRVCQHLAGIIGHVRLLLIDSQVFAEEVEPTGAVPIELSLERYRHAALPTKFYDSAATAVEDVRLRPRVTPHLFSGSSILSGDKSHYQRVLNNWFGNAKQNWRLVFRASAHAFSATAFHRHCDMLAPTFVIVMGVRGDICGGFSDATWSRPSSSITYYTKSERAFIFTLQNHQDVPPTKFPVVKKSFAICYHPELGPIFGAGADLYIANNCNQNMDSYTNMPHSYDGENASRSLLMGDYHFTVADYEVFTPVPGPKPQTKERYQ